MKYAAPIGDMLAGCYRSADPTRLVGKEDQFMISTQFQACEARRAFPCFDEPNLKASFTLEVEAKSDLVVLSNMPPRCSEKSSSDGLTRTIFHETPKMSTYVSLSIFPHIS